MPAPLVELLAVARFAGDETLRVLPVFLLSVGLGVLIRQLEMDAMIRRAFDARVGLAILLATAVGAFSPFCSCTVIPVVTGLLLSGVPLAPVMSFWVASPTMDPEIFALSVATLGWPLAVARLLATLAVSLGAGWLTLALTRSGVLATHALRVPAPARAAVRPLATIPVAATVGGGGGATTRLASLPVRRLVDAPASGACCAPRPSAPAAGGWADLIVASARRIRWSEFVRGVGVESVRLGRWLLLAFVLEAVIIRYVPQAAIARVLGADSMLAVPLAALVGIPLYLNNVSALPIVSGLLGQGMQSGAAVAFLIAGPVTTVPAMAAVWGTARPRVFALYVGVAIAGAIAAGVVTSAVLG
ncbi:MAG: permease [Candidatus Rokubacteria bacterium]|nr:permease [Candidatus Rokubacteria bacterium]